MLAKEEMARPNTTIYAFLLIAAALLIGNYQGIFDLKVMLNDDYFRYIYALEDTIPWVLARRNPLLPPVLYFFMSLVEVSLPLARAAMVVLVVLPANFLLYRVYSKYFGIHWLVAVAAVVLPSVLPGQSMLPMFIDGAYCLYGFLACMLGFYCGQRFVAREKGGWLLFCGAVLSFCCAAGFMDNVVFMFFPIAFSFFYFGKDRKRTLSIIALFALAAGAKLVYVLTHPWATSVPQQLPFEAILKRLALFFPYTLPLPFEQLYGWKTLAPLYVGIVLLFFAFGIFLLVFRPVDKVLDGRFSGLRFNRRGLFQVVFALVWIGANYAPFLTSYYYADRYLYIAAFGVCLLLVLIIRNLVGRFRGLAGVVPVLVILMAVTCYARNAAITKRYASRVNTFELVQASLAGREFPKDSQIVLLGNLRLGTGGHWHWARGLLKYVTGRPDIDGTMPYEYAFYDPFEPVRDWKKLMIGLSLDRPLFIYRVNVSSGVFAPCEYALRWLDPESPLSEWELYRLDSSNGDKILLERGKGIFPYLYALKQRGIERSLVVWGGLPSKKERKRMHLDEYLQKLANG